MGKIDYIDEIKLIAKDMGREITPEAADKLSALSENELRKALELFRRKQKMYAEELEIH